MVDAEREVRRTVGECLPVLSGDLPHGELIGSDDGFWSEVPRSQPIRSGQDLRHVLVAESRYVRLVAEAVDLVRLGQHSPDLSCHLVVTREGVVCPFEDDHLLLTCKRLDDRCFRERPHDVDVHGSDLRVVVLAEEVNTCLDVLRS